jgi:hypothetical protein
LTKYSSTDTHLKVGAYFQVEEHVVRVVVFAVVVAVFVVVVLVLFDLAGVSLVVVEPRC